MIGYGLQHALAAGRENFGANHGYVAAFLQHRRAGGECLALAGADVPSRYRGQHRVMRDCGNGGR